jgi:hypothetical protein
MEGVRETESKRWCERCGMRRASRTHILVCECWGAGLCVWEVAVAYRRNLVLRRPTPPAPLHAPPPPPLIAVAWAADGQLYALDPAAKLYSVSGDSCSSLRPNREFCFEATLYTTNICM